MWETLLGHKLKTGPKWFALQYIKKLKCFLWNRFKNRDNGCMISVTGQLHLKNFFEDFLNFLYIGSLPYRRNFCVHFPTGRIVRSSNRRVLGISHQRELFMEKSMKEWRQTRVFLIYKKFYIFSTNRFCVKLKSWKFKKTIWYLSSNVLKTIRLSSFWTYDEN